MDGNGRWAQSKGLPRIAGHRQGAESVREVVSSAMELGIQYLTLFGFSCENWKRSQSEVSALMGLLRLYLRQEVVELDRQGVRLRFIGYRERLPRDIVTLIQGAETKTSNNNTLTLTIALSYGARQEITTAAQKLAMLAAKGKIEPNNITDEIFGQYLETATIPDPDLIIRTSGVQRISNFLLWQLAYAELVFIDINWPDFSKKNLEEAVDEFNRRERRYGA
ncbi:MAG: di-trans,poly-cis-decaprenylcistransferase [Rhodospirillaceae bacterium]|nr:di-trans,poly-cis-decaprenylcistransferase [Rhodospirillaceae bacterium]|tara:strand:+ start:766 stop:1431 length:666 start_codon:yes stop_codon:yes gene_type:complete